ncbi:MAG: hypothetical protein ACREIA_06435 [Opitutaceae bacterium]
MHRATRWIEHADCARILERTFGNRITVGRSNEIPAAFAQRRVPAGHLDPEATEGVIREKFDDVARREELIADGEFVRVAGIARRGAAHRLPFVVGVEVLVEPAERLVTIGLYTSLGLFSPFAIVL